MPRLVYRLEDATGAGPYAGDQACSKFLQPHADPDRLLAMFGYPNEVLEALSAAGFVFGWSTLKEYRNFFYKNGEQKCRELGFNRVDYRPDIRFNLPDGQVMFLKDASMLNLAPTLKILLKVLEGMRDLSDGATLNPRPILKHRRNFKASEEG